ncbi:MAG: hypothetical protein O7J95_19310 [Planctomycetota bacterium]|nr:hypothetical protein [Planctomycetota bacterium]
MTSEKKITLKEASTADILAELEARSEAFRGASEDDLKAFQKMLEELRERLKTLSDDIKANFNVCPQLAQKLLSKQSAEEYFILLENDDRLREKTRFKLENLRRSLADSDEYFDTLVAFMGQGTKVHTIGNPDYRRSVKSVFDKCKNLKDDLSEWRKSARRGLEKIASTPLPEKLGLEHLLPEQPPAKSSSKSAAAERAKRRRRGREAEAGRDRERSRDAEEQKSPAKKAAKTTKFVPRVSRPTSSGSKDGPLPEAVDPATTSARTTFNHWTRWYPLVSSSLARNVTLSLIREAPATISRVRVLRGERELTWMTQPYREDPPESKPPTSLWDLPCNPPSGFQAGGEKEFRVPGSDTVEECRDCSGQGKSVSSGTRCSACGGKGKLLKYAICRTRYMPEVLNGQLCALDFPEELISLANGKLVFQDSFSFFPVKPDEEGREKKSLEAIERHVGPIVRQKTALKFFGRPESGGKQKQLINFQIEIWSFPVWEFDCEPKDPESHEKIKVWLYGEGRNFHAAGYPRRLTLKAAVWLLVAGLVGMGPGAALMYLVNHVF